MRTVEALASTKETSRVVMKTLGSYFPLSPDLSPRRAGSLVGDPDLPVQASGMAEAWSASVMQAIQRRQVRVVGVPGILFQSCRRMLEGAGSASCSSSTSLE